jgi:hypothetical protein
LKEEIEKLDGEYDQDGFYKLKDESFYDPLGYHYNKNGIDAVGGFYDEEGFYCAPNKTKPFSKKQIESFEGDYDEDNFYRIKEGGFFDEAGYYFDKEGKDHSGGYYNNDGIYVEGNADKKEEEEEMRSRPLDPEEIERLTGEYDDHDFYILDAGGFYDPHGHFFDAEGFDEVGGYYDDNDCYVLPKKKDLDDLYGDEDVSDEDEDVAAEIDMHVVPVKLWLEKNGD